MRLEDDPDVFDLRLRRISRAEMFGLDGYLGRRSGYPRDAEEEGDRYRDSHVHGDGSWWMMVVSDFKRLRLPPLREPLGGMPSMHRLTDKSMSEALEFDKPDCYPLSPGGPARLAAASRSAFDRHSPIRRRCVVPVLDQAWPSRRMQIPGRPEEGRHRCTHGNVLLSARGMAQPRQSGDVPDGCWPTNPSALHRVSGRAVAAPLNAMAQILQSGGIVQRRASCRRSTRRVRSLSSNPRTANPRQPARLGVDSYGGEPMRTGMIFGTVLLSLATSWLRANEKAAPSMAPGTAWTVDRSSTITYGPRLGAAMPRLAVGAQCRQAGTWRGRFHGPGGADVYPSAKSRAP